MDELSNGASRSEAELRLVRAREIASHPETIEKLEDAVWSVPSQTGFGRYRVSFLGHGPACTCKDYARRHDDCKHILAVRHLQSHAAGSRMQDRPTLGGNLRRRYLQHPSYSKAQEAEMRLVESLLRDLVRMVPEIPRPPGIPGPIPISFAEETFCAILKVYWGFSARRTAGVLQNVVDRGLLSRVPSYPLFSCALNRPEATPILSRLLSHSAIPLACLEQGGVVAPDSTGIQTTSFGAWREEKQGEKRERHWLKVHAIVGTKTHVIIRAVVSDHNSGDSPEFATLLRGALEDGFRPEVVVADKGYLSKENYKLASELGLEAYIPFRVNSVNRNGHRGTPKAWRDAFYLFQMKREKFDENYHKRSNVEAVFSALKRKFGETIRSRTPVAQINEVLCKLIAYNLTVIVHEMFENGITASFGERSSPT